MPSQTVGNVHVNVPLSNLARLYRPDINGFIADQVCPYIDVAFESNLYYLFDQGPFFATDVDDLVGDREEPREVEYSHSTDSYVCQRRELAWTISDRERKNADSQLNLERNKQVGTLGRLLLKREARVAALLRKTTNSGGLTSGANAAADWGTAGTTTIESDILTGREAVRQLIGIEPNVIVIPVHVASMMNKNSQIRDWLKYNVFQTGVNPLSERFPLLPDVFFGMRVLVPNALQNTAVEGQTATYSDVWSNHVRLIYVTQGPAIETPSTSYTFRSETLVTRQERVGKPRVDWYAVGQTIVEKVVAPDAGYEIASAAA
jgi:hypothetical protein